MAKETAPDKRGKLWADLLNQLSQTRQWITLLAECKKVLESGLKTKSPYGTGTTLDELALYYKFSAEQSLKQYDLALRDGELFIARHPQSMYFASVKALLENAIRQKREVEDGRGKVDAELKRLNSRERWNLCNIARVWASHHQWQEAERLYRACVSVGTHQKWNLIDLVRMDIEMGRWAQARKDAAEAEKLGDKDVTQAVHGLLWQVPTDG
jgi:tetratricopeptide (TPR) repeat protein